MSYPTTSRQNQPTTPYNTINITLPRARTFDSISLAILDDTASGGVLACSYALQIKNRNNVTLASRSPWTSCTGNSLNTINLDNGSVTSDFPQYHRLQLHLPRRWDFRYPDLVPFNPGQRYETEDGILGTLFGSFEGRKSGMNATIQNGGVTLRENASSSWIEIADVRSGLGASGVDGGTRNVTSIGYGNGSTIVGMNFLSNQTVQFTGSSPNTTQNVTLGDAVPAGGERGDDFWWWRYGLD